MVVIQSGSTDSGTRVRLSSAQKTHDHVNDGEQINAVSSVEGQAGRQNLAVQCVAVAVAFGICIWVVAHHHRGVACLPQRVELVAVLVHELQQLLAVVHTAKTDEN